MGDKICFTYLHRLLMASLRASQGVLVQCCYSKSGLSVEIQNM